MFNHIMQEISLKNYQLARSEMTAFVYLYFIEVQDLIYQEDSYYTSCKQIYDGVITSILRDIIYV